MVAREQVHDGLFLMGPRLNTFDVRHPIEKSLVDLVRVDVALAIAPIRRQRAQRTVIRIVSHDCQSSGWHELECRTCVRIIAYVAVQ